MTINFSRFNDTVLADELGAQEIVAKEASARLKALKEEVKARDGETFIGRSFIVTVVKSVRWTLDTKRVKEFLGTDKTTELSNQKFVETIKVSAKVAEAA